MFVTCCQRTTSRVVAALRAIPNPSQAVQAARATTAAINESRTHRSLTADVGTGILTPTTRSPFHIKSVAIGKLILVALKLFWGEQPPFTPAGVGGGNFLITSNPLPTHSPRTVCTRASR